MDDSLVAQRKNYGALPRKAIIPEDTSLEAVWRWEVQLMDLLPADKVGGTRRWVGLAWEGGGGGGLMGEGSSRGGGTYSRDGLEVGGGCGGDTWWRVCARAANPCRTFSPVLGTNYLKKLSDVSPKRDRTPTRGLR